MIGQTFNRLTVLSDSGRRVGNKTIYVCQCECGKSAFVDKYKLQSGHTKSCGCFKLDNLSVIKTTHGLTATPEHKAWQEMKQRCLNPNQRVYRHYGGRGIKVCVRWIDSFEAFLADIGPRPSTGHSIDRIDVNGNYEPKNCRWATNSEQQNNRRNTTKFEYLDGVYSLTQIARATGIKQQTLFYKVRVKGMPMLEAIASCQ